MKRELLILFLTVSMIAATFSITSVQATDTIGRITSDATWTKANSPYKLTGPVNVNNGVILTIEPGVTVALNNYYIQVEGTLRAIGSNSNQITFNSGTLKFTENSNGWNQQTGAGCIIENCALNSVSITSSRNAIKINQNSIIGEVQAQSLSIISSNTIVGQLHILGATLVWRNTITGGISTLGIGTNPQSYPMISSNTISGNNGYLQAGISCSGYALIADNTISDCTYGISLGTIYSPMGDANQNAIVQRNKISGNTHGLHLELFTAMLYGNANPTMDSNTISQNKIGVYIDGISKDIIFKDNNLQDNSEYNFRLASGEYGNITASSNWWGTTDKSAISQTIYDSNRDFNLGTVNFEPFLNSANALATPDLNAPIPTSSPLNSPTPTTITHPTATPTSQPTDSPTPTQSPNQTATGNSIFGGANMLELGIFVALITIIALLVVLIALVLKRRAPKHS